MTIATVTDGWSSKKIHLNTNRILYFYVEDSFIKVILDTDKQVWLKNSIENLNALGIKQ